MHVVTLAEPDDFEGWRDAARRYAMAGVAPDEVNWRVGGEARDLFATEAAPPPDAPGATFPVPRAFLTLAELVIRHADPERFALLYALLWRIKANPKTLESADSLVERLERMAGEVRRGLHLQRHGKDLPESALAAGAGEGEAAMAKRKLTQVESDGLASAAAAESRLEPGGNARAAWTALLEDAKACTRCPLYKPATQTVFGEGPLDARIMFVGEQPGDQEDLAGRPFVGPAGQLFDRALGDAGVDRAQTYVTNAVKHFKFEPRGRRRIHSKPDASEIEACRWWIEQERLLIRPPVTVALGATAARSLFGKVMTIGRVRGAPMELPGDGGEAWVTVHPSFLLRLPDEEAKRVEYGRFVEDLARIGERAKELVKGNI